MKSDFSTGIKEVLCKKIIYLSSNYANVGSQALSFSGPLLSVSVDFYMCVRNFEVQYLENQRS